MKQLHKFVIPVAGLALLSGCATTNFAPPVVLTEHRLEETDSCTMRKQIAIERDTIKGAADLVNNYVYAYRCQTGELSGGRKWFQIPGYLGLAVSTAAIAFGAGPLVAVAGGSFASVANAGNGYFAPEQKAVITNKALNAVICIQNESVGVPAFAAPDKPDPKGDAAAAAAAAALTGTVAISWNQQYFTMVKAALLSVETVVRERLVSAGTYNPSGTIAEIEALQKKAEEARKKAEANQAVAETGEATATPTDAPVEQGTPAEDEPAPGADTDVGIDGKAKVKVAAADATKRKQAEATEKAAVRAEAKARVSELALAEMQPKLALCVERAKL